ncbi:MAG: hypothetical protein L3K19_08195 [Thermoplasmata archaeon]|nr:hypothetical protein [Thermoplasmata archaeon]
MAIVLLLLLSGVLPDWTGVGHAASLPGGARFAGPLSRSSLDVRSAVADLESGGGPAAGLALGCRIVDPASAQCSVASPHPSTSPAGNAAGYGWREVPNHPGGQAQGPVLMAADSTDGFVLLLGTRTGAPSNNPADSQSWAFRSGAWTRLFPPTTPAVCAASVLSDDPGDQGVLYVGAAGCAASGSTWLFHRGNWTNQTGGLHPPVRTSASMSYSSGDGEVVLFGGANPNGHAGSLYFNDTWAFSSGSWSNLTGSAGTAPPMRADAQQVDDVSDGSVILWGGLGAGWLNDTWAFGGGRWTQVAAKGAPCLCSYLTEARTVYDAADGYVLLIGAQNATRGPYMFAYQYSAGLWSKITTNGVPTDRNLPGLAYDPHDHLVVLFGGRSYAPNPGSTPQNDTWTLRARNWTSWDGPGPAPRVSASLSYDAADGYVLLFGGWVVPPFAPFTGNLTGVNDTWKFVGGAWTELFPSRSPSPRFAAGLVDDLSDGYLVLYGGTPTNSYTPLRDTWEFLNGSWTMLTPATAPPAQSTPSMVYDGADGYVLLYTAAPNGQSWAFHSGGWRNLTSTVGPRPGAPTDPLVYDAADGYVLLFAPSGSAGPSPSNQTWSYLNGNWTNLTALVGGAPPPTANAEVFYDPGSASVVMFTDGGSTWTYSQRAWTPQYPAGAPPGRTNGPSTFDGKDRYGLFFGGQNNSNWNSPGYTGSVCPGSQLRPCGDTWSWTSGVGSTLRILSFGFSPSGVDQGGLVNVTASVSGGLAPYHYAYAGLPAGCPTQNLSTFSCRPSATGAFVVTLTVTDRSGNQTAGSATVTVSNPPSIQGFVASPSSLAVAGRTVLTVNVSGGTPPLAYLYTGLPPGCTSQTVPSLPCFPAASGNYTISVFVNDSGGQSANARAALAVTPVGAAGGPVISAFLVSPSSVTLGNSTNLSVVASGGGAYRSYAYVGLPAGCSSSNTSALGCRPTSAGVYPVQATVTGANGANVSVGTNLTVYPVGGGGSPSILAFVASPTAITLGDSTTLTVVARGNASLSYRFGGLPPGCVSVDTANLPCTPTSIGNYRIHAIVSDPYGAQLGVFGVLTVDPSGVHPLSIAQFVAAPSVLTLGQSLYLVVSTSGGVAPLQFAYTGLPPGCLSENATSLTCVPTSAGSFNVTVTITDALNHSANARQSVQVLPARAPGPGPQNGSTPFDLFAADGGALVVVLGFVFGLAVTALATEAYRRRRLAAEGQELVREMTAEPQPDPDDAP